MKAPVGAVPRALGRELPAPPLTPCLPWISYDSDEGIFALDGGRQGRVYEVEPIGAEGEGDDARQHQLEMFERALVAIPQEMTGQFLWWASGDAEDRIRPYEKQAPVSGDKPWETVLRTKLAATRTGTRGLFGDGDYRVRRVRSYVTLAAPAGANARGELLRAARDLEGGFASLGIGYRVIGPREALAPAFWALNVGLAEMRPFRLNGGFVEGRALRDRLVQGEIEVCEDHLRVWGRRLYGVSLTRLPGSMRAGMLNEVLERYTGEMILTVNFRVMSPHESRQSQWIKMFLAGRRARPGATGSVNFEAKVVYDELVEVLTEVEKKNKRLARFSAHVFFSTDEAGADAAKARVTKAFGALGAEATVEDAVLLPTLISALPLGHDARHEDFLKRARTVMSDRLTCLAPLWGFLRSTPTPTQMYLSRLGVPVSVDPFDCDAGMHGLVIATTGVGKSFFANEWIAQIMRLTPTPYVFILDVGGSYRRMCEVMGGQYVVISMEKPTRINPFYGDLIDVGQGANIHAWMSLLIKLAEVNVDNKEKAIEEENILESALRLTFERRQTGQEVTISDLVATLRSRDEEAWKSLANRLLVFTKSGRYGMFFDGANELDITKTFVVFDLTDLSNMERLQGPMMLIITNMIMRTARKEELRGTRKYVMIDEAWKFLKDKNTGAFVEEAYRTFRKYSAAAWIITQDVTQVWSLGCGPGILGNANSGFFLQQNPKSLPKLQEIMQFSDADVAELRAVRTWRGRYSEFFYFSRVGGREHKGIGRLVASPEIYWMSTSDGAEAERYRKKREELGGAPEAIWALAREFPAGLYGAAKAPMEVEEETE